MQITFNPLDPDDFNRVVTFMQAMGAIQTMIPNEQSEPPQTVTDTAATQTEVAPELDPRIGLELDANGTPWLEAVHAGTKKQDKDGVWKKRRGVDDDVKLKAEAEARARLAATPETGAVPNETAGDAVADPAAAFPTAAPVVETAPTMPGVTIPGLPGGETPTPPQAPPCTLEELGALYSQAVDAGVVTSETIMDVYSQAGLANPSEIQTDDIKRAAVAQILRGKMGTV